MAQCGPNAQSIIDALSTGNAKELPEHIKARVKVAISKFKESQATTSTPYATDTQKTVSFKDIEDDINQGIYPLHFNKEQIFKMAALEIFIPDIITALVNLNNIPLGLSRDQLAMIMAQCGPDGPKIIELLKGLEERGGIPLGLDKVRFTAIMEECGPYAEKIIDALNNQNTNGLPHEFPVNIKEKIEKAIAPFKSQNQSSVTSRDSGSCDGLSRTSGSDYSDSHGSETPSRKSSMGSIGEFSSVGSIEKFVEEFLFEIDNNDEIENSKKSYDVLSVGSSGTWLERISKKQKLDNSNGEIDSAKSSVDGHRKGR